MTNQEAKDEVRNGLRPEIQVIWDNSTNGVQSKFANDMMCFRDDSPCMEFTNMVKG
jgi:hypothetical protein